MSKKPLTDPDNEAERVPMSQDEIDKMTLNVYDQVFLKRLLDMQFECVCAQLAEVIEAANNKLFAEIEKLNKRIDGIEDRVEKLEKAVFK